MDERNRGEQESNVGFLSDAGNPRSCRRPCVREGRAFRWFHNKMHFYWSPLYAQLLSLSAGMNSSCRCVVLVLLLLLGYEQVPTFIS
jgi:hypothetical protein